MDEIKNTNREVTNGAAMAAVLAAGTGSFALGFIVLLKTMNLLPLPALYEPAGGVSTRTTLAVVIWLISWVILHRRWNGRHIQYGRTGILSLALIGLSILLTFPPFWNLF